MNPNYDAPSVSRDRSEKENNIEELRIQLREEKLYGQKIKEELDRIQSVVAQATDVPEGEVPYLLQQIQVLEAGKSMGNEHKNVLIFFRFSYPTDARIRKRIWSTKKSS